MELKNLSNPDEIRNLPKTKIDVLNFSNANIMRAEFSPGWEWSKDVKPTVGTETCEDAHVLCIISGQMEVIMDDGTKKIMKAGDVATIPPGHDARTIGNEPCIALDFAAAETYGKKE